MYRRTGMSPGVTVVTPLDGVAPEPEITHSNPFSGDDTTFTVCNQRYSVVYNNLGHGWDSCAVARYVQSLCVDSAYRNTALPLPAPLACTCLFFLARFIVLPDTDSILFSCAML